VHHVEHLSIAPKMSKPCSDCNIKFHSCYQEGSPGRRGQWPLDSSLRNIRYFHAILILELELTTPPLADLTCRNSNARVSGTVARTVLHSLTGVVYQHELLQSRILSLSPCFIALFMLTQFGMPLKMCQSYSVGQNE
jgi:hypothetical protein